MYKGEVLIVEAYHIAFHVKRLPKSEEVTTELLRDAGLLTTNVSL